MTVPEGSIPVFSTDTEEQARRLIVASCELNFRGEPLARELATEQTIGNLIAFGERLAVMADRIGLFKEGT